MSLEAIRCDWERGLNAETVISLCDGGYPVMIVLLSQSRSRPPETFWCVHRYFLTGFGSEFEKWSCSVDQQSTDNLHEALQAISDYFADTTKKIIENRFKHPN